MELRINKNQISLFKIISLFSILIASLSSCTTLNKDFSKVTQQPVPEHNKFISGHISDNKYYALDNSFSIDLPFKRGKDEFNLMEISEFYHEKGSDISFGPFGQNKSMYFIELIRVNKENVSDFEFEEASFKLFNQHYKSLAKYSADRKKMNREVMKIKGNRTIHWNLLQLADSGRYSDFSPGLTKHHIFTIELKHYIAFIMVQKPSNTPDGINLKSAYDFAFSLSLLENKSEPNQLMALPE